MGFYNLPPHFFVNNSSSVTKPSMPKRKHSDDGQSHMADEHEDARTGPATLVIDPEGDLYMKLDAGSLKVSRKALSLSSPVFLAMLGANSKFKEATDMTVDYDGIQIVSFEWDKFETMTIIARIIHFQNHEVPERLTFYQLFQAAVMCDKYDLRRCLGPWTNVWTKPYLDCYTRQGYEEWLFMSIVFQYGGLFKDLTRHLIINSEISGQLCFLTHHSPFHLVLRPRDLFRLLRLVFQLLTQPWEKTLTPKSSRARHARHQHWFRSQRRHIFGRLR